MSKFLDYNSVILTVDHTTDIAPHVVQKVVYSTETLEETAVALLNYYGEQALLTSIETIKQFQELGKAERPGLAYRTRENVQIILSVETFAALVERSENLLECHQFILDTVGHVLSTIEKEAGKVFPLTAFDWATGEDIEAVSEEEVGEA